MTNAFSNVITSEAQLRETIGAVLDIAETKVIPVLDAHCEKIIAASPFLLISSADANGNMDVSPKGDPAGFVKILDEKRLAIPDRPGNRRADTMLNIIQNPHVGLLFLVPGMRETLRVNGTAQVVADQWLLDSLALRNKAPQFAIVITVDEVFIHCARCITGAKLWDAASWPPVDDMPTLNELIRDHTRIHQTR